MCAACVCGGVGGWGCAQASLDYIIKLLDSGDNVEHFIGMPADLRTAAQQA